MTKEHPLLPVEITSWHVSIIHGADQHDIGRVSTEEVASVMKAKENKRRFGDLIKEPTQIHPFGVYDQLKAKGEEV